MTAPSDMPETIFAWGEETGGVCTGRWSPYPDDDGNPPRGEAFIRKSEAQAMVAAALRQAADLADEWSAEEFIGDPLPPGPAILALIPQPADAALRAVEAAARADEAAQMERMRAALERMTSWTQAALDCEAWTWDADQREVAEAEVVKARAALEPAKGREARKG